MTLRTLMPENASVPGMLKHLLFPGVVGLVLLFGERFFALMSQDPRSAFLLLDHWGPAFLLGVIAIGVVGGLLSQVVDISRDQVAAQQRSAESMQSLAVAVKEIAEKDDREWEHMITLTAYGNKRIEEVSVQVTEMRDEQRAFFQLMKSAKGS